MKTELKVLLTGHTPEAEKAISAAAKLCYSPLGVEDVLSSVEKTDNNAFLRGLIAAGHLSPIEHASFTFAIEGISRACSHQLVRHRLASYSQQSQRYVDEKRFNYIIPRSIEDDDQLKIRFEELMGHIQKSYQDLVDALCQAGHDIENAREDARFILPNAAETKIVMTMNARELLYFFSLRLCNRAQWEIRALAYAMLRLVQRVAPVIFERSGPPCVTGKCPEGSKSCGKADEVRQKFTVKDKEDQT
ncbi:MAG TPA: FAD-dependent thymidylate synthase [Syntrophorhabdaceae bacterium]|nr:FAD-dependent thymidylate synthase [Syntrophorhabdaceae bacterium]